MKFVITGGTRAPRGELYATGIKAGLTPMNSVSTKTSLLVCNDPNLLTRKASRAAERRPLWSPRSVSGPCSERFGRGSALRAPDGADHHNNGGTGPAEGVPDAGARWSAPGLRPGSR